MPSSTPKRQERWETDSKAIKFLEDAGYKLTRQWFWRKPTLHHVVTLDEGEAVIYLIEEWDFGGILI